MSGIEPASRCLSPVFCNPRRTHHVCILVEPAEHACSAQFERLRRELDDVFGVSGLPSSIRSVTPGTVPAINVGRTPTSVEVYAFAPGWTRRGSRSRWTAACCASPVSVFPASRPTIPKLQVYTRERGTGSFTRAMALPDDVDPAQVQASYKDGVLQVSIARRESAQPQRITVQ
jgi:HSP20 family protein